LKARSARIILIIVFLVILSPFLLLYALWVIDFVQLRFISTPEQVLTRYYTEKDLAEDQLIDSLILGGSKMVPILEKEILKKDIVRRRYAILALGNIGDKNSIPVLEQILQDRDEKEYYRGDALVAIALIDLSTAQKIAPQYLSETGSLSKRARDTLSPTPFFWAKRPYWDAFFRVHD